MRDVDLGMKVPDLGELARAAGGTSTFTTHLYGAYDLECWEAGEVNRRFPDLGFAAGEFPAAVVLYEKDGERKTGERHVIPLHPEIHAALKGFLDDERSLSDYAAKKIEQERLSANGDGPTDPE